MGNTKDGFVSGAVKKLNRRFMKSSPQNQDDSELNKDLKDKSTNAPVGTSKNVPYAVTSSKLARIGMFNAIFNDAGIDSIFTKVFDFSQATVAVRDNSDNEKRTALLVKEAKASSKLRKWVILHMQPISNFQLVKRDASVYTLLLANYIYTQMFKDNVIFERRHFAFMQNFVDTFSQFILSVEEVELINVELSKGNSAAGSYFNSYLSDFTGGKFASSAELTKDEYNSNSVASSNVLLGALTIFIYTLGAVSSYDRTRLTPDEEHSYQDALDLIKGESPFLKYMNCHFEATDALFGVKKDVVDREQFNINTLISVVTNGLLHAHDSADLHAAEMVDNVSVRFNHKIDIPMIHHTLPPFYSQKDKISVNHKILRDTYHIPVKDFDKVKRLLNEA